MLREILIKNLNEQLDYLESEHVEELMKERREEELLEIIDKGIKIGKLNFAILEDYCQLMKLNCRISEISGKKIYEFILYINQSEIEDERFFFSDSDVMAELYKKEEPIATHIAELMKEYVLSTVSLHDILFEGTKVNREIFTLREYVINDLYEQLEYLSFEYVA